MRPNPVSLEVTVERKDGHGWLVMIRTCGAEIGVTADVAIGLAQQLTRFAIEAKSKPEGTPDEA